MAEPRNFDDEFDYGSKQGVSFVLGGQTFTTKPIAPVKAFLEAEQGLQAAITFLSHTLIAEDRDRFHELINDPDSLISGYQLDQIASWVIEETSGRPTVTPASSGAGAGSTPTTLKGGSSSRAKTGTE